MPFYIGRFKVGTESAAARPTSRPTRNGRRVVKFIFGAADCVTIVIIIKARYGLIPIVGWLPMIYSYYRSAIKRARPTRRSDCNDHSLRPTQRPTMNGICIRVSLLIHEIFVYRVSCVPCILIHETTYTIIYKIIHDNTR